MVPSINIWVKTNKNSILRASFAKGFRAPSLKELYLEFHYNATINLWGNTNLNSENSNHFNVSYQWNKTFGAQQLKVRPKFYYSKINNLIDLAQTSNVDWTYTNINYLITQGVSLLFDYSYKDWSLVAEYSYYGNYNSMYNQKDVPNTFFYSNDFNIGANYLIKKIDLKLNLFYKYTGYVQNYYLDQNNVVTPSSIGAYNNLDFTAMQSLLNKKMVLTAGVKNVFDVKDVKMVGKIFGVSNAKNANSLNVLWGRTFFVALNFNL